MSDFLTDIPREGEPVSFSEKTEEPTPSGDEQGAAPAVSSTENGQTETSPSSDGEAQPSEAVKGEGADNNPNDNKVPFHKHPRWKAINDENAALKASLKEFMDYQKEMLSRVVPQQPAATPSPQQEQIPDWFKRAYGEDPEVWKLHQQVLSEQKKAIIEDLKREQAEEAKRAEEETKKWQDWVDTSIKSVEETYGVKLASNDPKTNEFIKWVIEFKPTDDVGNLDLVKGYKIFSELKREPPERVAARKQIAAQTTTEDKPGAKTKDRGFFTPQDFRNRGWKNLF